MSLLATVWTVVAVLLLLISERAHRRTGVWIAKTAASLGFVAVAWLAPDVVGSYRLYMLAALCACALGDVLLLPSGRGATFLAGLGSFALGHALFAAAFWRLPLQPSAAGIAALAMAIAAWFTLRWLDSHLDRPLYWAVRGYIAIIGAMVALAVGASAATGDPRIAAGAIAFAISDLSVARDRFVHPGFENLVWGLPLYYAAQLILAWTVLR